jgi:hypothetical protein
VEDAAAGSYRDPWGCHLQPTIDVLKGFFGGDAVVVLSDMLAGLRRSLVSILI